MWVLEGRLKITDTSRSGNSDYGFHVTEITRSGNTIQTTVNGVTTESSGNTTTYTPKANQVYGFESSQLRLETQGRKRVWRGLCWGCDLRTTYENNNSNRGSATYSDRGEVVRIEGSGPIN